MRLLFDNAVMEVLAGITLSLSRPLWGLSVDGADICAISSPPTSLQGPNCRQTLVIRVSWAAESSLRHGKVLRFLWASATGEKQGTRDS